MVDVFRYRSPQCTSCGRYWPYDLVGLFDFKIANGFPVLQLFQSYGVTKDCCRNLLMSPNHVVLTKQVDWMVNNTKPPIEVKRAFPPPVIQYRRESSPIEPTKLIYNYDHNVGYPETNLYPFQEIPANQQVEDWDNPIVPGVPVYPPGVSVVDSLLSGMTIDCIPKRSLLVF